MKTLSISTPNNAVLFDSCLLHQIHATLARLTHLAFRRHCQRLCLRFTVSQTQAIDVTLCQQKTDDWKIEHITQWQRLDTSQPSISHWFDFKKHHFQTTDTSYYSMNSMQHDTRLKDSFERWQSIFLSSPIVDAQLRLLP
ncbi:hypothetical protein [Vibrio sp. ER1A]|uniref:hypothetical protein n=1 Tax=Vibrio sp. ER1A TaxID=1517681 RepID=UPI000A82058F|nr:hypothetical protein [Vibrio sp. ER1A]